ncbi:hypothetical protein [Rossellomorea vietnamensis]
MADKKKKSKEYSTYEKKNDRHNDNARAAASLKSDAPRINTDNL